MFAPNQGSFATVILICPAPGTAAPASGLLAGTRIETMTGWRTVDTLRSGDLVQTLDGGLRQVRRLRRRRVRPADGLIHLPGGILSNNSDLVVLPDQKLLINGVALERLFRPTSGDAAPTAA